MFNSTISEAENLLDSYMPKAGSYYELKRNFSIDLDTNKNTTSLLSPYIRYRILSEENILKEVLNKHSYFKAEKYIQEIFWRTYWKGWLEHRPEVYDDYLLDKNILLNKFENKKFYQNAIIGNTNYKFFNNWVLDLKNKGYLHNHIRMWFASIWIFNLNLPWQLGADFFMQHLLDGDPASNTLSWRWVSGIQTKGKNYIARKSNIEKYSNIKLNENEILNENVYPIQDDKVYNIKEININHEINTDNIKAIIVPTDEINIVKDLNIQNCNSFYGLPFNDYNDHKFDIKIINHIKKITLSLLNDDIFYQTSNYELHFDNYYDELNKWINNKKINEIYLPYVTKGNWKNIYKKIIKNNPSVNFIVFNRNYDAKSWIYSKKGFFNFKKNIQKIIAEIIQ